MKDTKNPRTLVYGLGESGLAAVRALLRQDPDNAPVAADGNDSDFLRKVAENLLEEASVEVVLGAEPSVFDGVSRVVASPGVRPSDPVLRAASERGVPVVSEVGLGLEIIGAEVVVSAVTGTNGKTTVADMTGRILEVANLPHVVAGNSWRALCGITDEVRDSGRLVLEVSSFQLHYLPEPGFSAASLLNVRPDHMNWHASYEEYVCDKLAVFGGQTQDDIAFVSANDPVGSGAAPELRAEVVTIGRGDTLITAKGEVVLRGERLVSVGELRLAGPHNLENALFAAGAAMKLGAGIEAVREGLISYEPKPHRIEVVARSGGVTWVDDSKATNPAAVVAALGSFVGSPVVLILGGSEKDTDFSEVEAHLSGCRAVICCGEAGPRLYRWLEEAGYGDVAKLSGGLADAVSEAKRTAVSGEVVLLSPGCASFDEFSGYAERGEVFAGLARGG